MVRLLARLLALGGVVVAACYHQPAFEDPCSITCTDSCPDGLACGADGKCHDSSVVSCAEGPGSDAGPQPLHGYLSVQVGARHACALDTDHAIYCWGDGGDDQLGVDGVASATAPGRVGLATDTWDALAVGGEHACALQAGAVRCWGHNDNGQANGAPRAPLKVGMPDTVAFPSGTPPPAFESISAGGLHTCAIGAGQLWCWGARTQIGMTATTAVQIEPGTQWRQVSAGVDHTCAVSGEEVRCWGANDKQQVGPGGSPVATPTMITLPAGHVVRAIASSRISCAILGATADATSGALWCWGNNGKDNAAPHILQPTGPTAVTIPTQIGAETDWTDASGGENFMCGTRGGNVYCWGGSDAGVLGTGKWTTLVTPSNYDPAKPVAAAGAVSVGVGVATVPVSVDDVACMIAGGHLSCWGGNEHGSLGLGGVAQHVAPAEVVPPAGAGGPWKHLYGGDRHTCAMTMDGALWCWGADDLGQVSAGPALGADKPCTLAKCDAPRPTRMTLADVKDVRAGIDFTCALDGSGVVHCWGKGTDGELGTDAATDAHEVVAVSGTYAALLGGGTGMCAEPTAGDPPVCWGHVPRTSAPPKVFGPITLPAAADSGMQAFDFGASFGCGIGPAGQRVCWGNDTSGALGNGVQGGNTLTPTDLGGDEIQLTAAGNHGCAVTATAGVECWGENFREQCGLNGANVLTPTAVTVDGFNPLVGCAEVLQSNLVSCVRCAATSGPARTDVLCWGEHDTGGGGTVATPNGQPRSLALAGMHDFSELAVYARGGCALDAQGKLFCWGTGYHGENGDGGHAANLPTPILPPTN